jgi:hypothetical protein
MQEVNPTLRALREGTWRSQSHLGPPVETLVTKQPRFSLLHTAGTKFNMRHAAIGTFMED